MNARVYVVNVSYECVGGCRPGRAIYLTNICRHCGKDVNGSEFCTHSRHSPKAEVIKYSDKSLRSERAVTKLPHVIRVFEHIPLYNRRLKYSNRMVWERDNFKCRYCGMAIASKSQLTTDHLKPRSRGGKTCFENMVTACYPCNKKKADRTLEESGMRLLGPNPPQIPRISWHMKKVSEEVQKILKEEWAKIMSTTHS